THIPSLRIAHFAMGRTNPWAADGVDRTVYHLARSQAAQGPSRHLFSVTSKPPIPIPGVLVSTYASLEPPVWLRSARWRDLLVLRAPLQIPAALSPTRA